jgi:hypothetical protein
MSLYETTIRINPEGDANELQSLYQSYFPGQTLSPADIDYYTKAGGINALLQEFEGLKLIGQPTINVQPASPPPSADNWMSGVIFDQSKLPANFDWQNYLTRYSDLGAAGIDTPLEAQRHYALYGSTEGRQFAPEVVNQDAVKNLYQSVLGREADPGGLAYWASQFGSDVSPEEEAAFRQASQAEIAARPPAGGLSVLDQGPPVPGNLPQDTTLAARTYNGTVYATVAEADAQRVKDLAAAGQQPAQPEVGAVSDLQQTFTPGSVLSSGFGNVAEQLGGSGYYKGVAVPTFYDKSLGDAGYETAGDQLARWKAGIDQADLSTNAPFGFVETPVYTQPGGDYDPYVSGYEQTPATAIDYLLQNNPVIADAIGPHTSTFANSYKIVNGELKEVGASEITPEDIASGNAFFFLGGKTGGPNRERMAQLYRAEGDQLIPVGDPKMYKGAVEQDMGLTFLDMAASALAWVPGPWQIPAQIYVATRGAMQGDISGFVKMVAPPVVSAAYDVYKAVDSGNYVGALMSVMGQTDLGAQLGSTDLGGGLKVNDVITAANVVDRINAGDYAGALRGVGSLTGSSEVSTAGSALQLAKAIESGNPQAIMAAGQGLINNVNNLTAKSDVANLLINSKDIGAIDADAGGITSPLTQLKPPGSPTEDEQIAQQQRVIAANQAISDYLGPGNDLSREGLVGQLTNLVGAEQANTLAAQADTAINQRRVSADVINRYSQVDPEFGTPALARNVAVKELEAAGFDTAQANDILDGVDRQVAAARTAALNKAAQDQAAIAAGAGEFSGADQRAAIAAGAGEFAGADKSAAVNARIANAASFNDAYAIARAEFGPNATFNYGGKLYSTATAEERPDLSGKPVDKTAPENQKSLDLTGATQWDLSLMKTPLGFDAFNATTARLMSPQEFRSLMSDPKLGIDPSTLDQRYQAYLYSQAPRVAAGQRISLPFEIAYRPPSDIYENPPTSFDEFKNTVLGGVAAGSKVASDAQNLVNSLTAKVAALTPNIIAGVASSVTGDTQNSVSTLMRQIGDIASTAGDIVVPELSYGAQQIGDAVSNADGFKNKVSALVNAVIENPASAMWWTATEGAEELVPIGVAAKVLKLTGSMRAAAFADGIANFLETQGLTQEELAKGFENLGLTSTQAAQAASPGAFAAGVVESVLSPLTDLPILKVLAKEGADVGQTVGKRALTVLGSGAKETVGESLQEGAGSVAKQLATKGSVDANEALTDTILGGWLGGKTSAVMTTLDAASQANAIGNATAQSIDELGTPGIAAITSSSLKSQADPTSALTTIYQTGRAEGINDSVLIANMLVGADAANVDLGQVLNGLQVTLKQEGLTVDQANQLINDSAALVNLGDKLALGTTELGDKTAVGDKIDLSGAGDKSTVKELAKEADVRATLDAMGVKPTDALISSLMEGSPTNQEVLARMQSQAELIQSLRGTPDSGVPATSGTPVTSDLPVTGGTPVIQNAPIGQQAAARSDVEATLQSMGLTPTKEAVDSLMQGNPTNDQVLAKLRSSPELLASMRPAVAPEATPGTTTSGPTTSGGQATIVVDGNTTKATETVGNNVIETVVSGNITQQTSSDSKTGTVTVTQSDGNQTVQVTDDGKNLVQITTDSNGNTTKVTDDGNKTVTITSDGKTGSVSTVVGNSTSNTSISGNSIVNVTSNNNVSVETVVDLKTNTFVQYVTDLATGKQDSVSGGSGDLDPAIIEDAKSIIQLQPVIPPVVPTLQADVSPVTPSETKKTVTKPSISGGEAGMLAAASLSGRKSPEDWLGGKLLQSKELGKYYDPLAGVFDTRLPVVPEVPETPVQEEEMRLPYYTYGQEPSMDEIFGEIPVGVEEEEPVYRMGGQVMNPQFMYAKGGLPRQDFRDGKHVAGPGDGQSDDIPAMLADGEFVFPADVVAALGNGSTKAGTEKLYEMMHAIRQRARSNKPKDLPPPALKSPLDYLKKR